MWGVLKIYNPLRKPSIRERLFCYLILSKDRLNVLKWPPGTSLRVSSIGVLSKREDIWNLRKSTVVENGVLVDID